MIGSPAISTRLMIGSSMVRGRLMRIFEIASFTSLTARSWFTSRRNSIVVIDEPSEMVERMCLTPFTPATESSTHFVTWVCNSAGAAPDCVIVTETIGMSMLGNRVIGRARKLTRPSTISTRNSTSEGIGLRIAQAETLRRMAISSGAILSAARRQPEPRRGGPAAPGRRRAGTSRRGPPPPRPPRGRCAAP